MGMTVATRIVLAKIGLDGHDRGIKVVARGLRDEGFHVIYAGLWQSLEAVVKAVADEDAGWLGLSLLSGAAHDAGAAGARSFAASWASGCRRAGRWDHSGRGCAKAHSARRRAGIRSRHGAERDR